MGAETQQRAGKVLWALARQQHGVVTRAQLAANGYSPKAIRHRVATGRLHQIYHGVFAIGRPAVTLHGRWIAAVLTCGPRAVLSHSSAAALWLIRPSSNNRIHVSLPAGFSPRPRARIAIHRRPTLTANDITRHAGIPVTTPICTLIDLATSLDARALEAAVNEADKLGLTNPERLRVALTQRVRRPGVRQLRELLDQHTFSLTDSELERRFLRLAREAGLPKPMTQARVSGYKVDFYWPALELVIETDGLRYHRTPAQQAKDRARDQALTAAGIIVLRFTHAQVRFEPGRVEATLAAVRKRLTPTLRSS